MTAETADRLLELCKANFPLRLDIDLKGTLGLWLQTFGYTADDLMETAIRLCLLECKSFPTIADIRKAIDELRREDQTHPKPKQLNPRSDWTSQVAQKAFMLACQDKIQDFIQEIDLSDIRDLAKSTFPNISEDLIRRNYNELIDYRTSQETCFHCRYDKNICTNHGYYISPVLRADGWIVNELAQCNKHGEFHA